MKIYRILAVEDDDNLRRGLSLALTSDNIKISEAGSLSEAYRFVSVVYDFNG